MVEQTFVLKTPTHVYRVEIGPLDLVVESELPVLLGKYSSDVWRWARQHVAKVYNSEFLPIELRTP
jgi:hypothetical protein